jgi:hypothetical protein
MSANMDDCFARGGEVGGGKHGPYCLFYFNCRLYLYTSTLLIYATTLHSSHLKYAYLYISN